MTFNRLTSVYSKTNTACLNSTNMIKDVKIWYANMYDVWCLLTKVLAIAYGDAKAVGTSPLSRQRTISIKD